MSERSALKRTAPPEILLRHPTGNLEKLAIDQIPGRMTLGAEFAETERALTRRQRQRVIHRAFLEPDILLVQSHEGSRKAAILDGGRPDRMVETRLAPAFNMFTVKTYHYDISLFSEVAYRLTNKIPA